MGRAYTYCHHCQGGLPAATIHEVVMETQECPHCGRYLTPNRTLTDIVSELIDTVGEQAQRIEQLETQVDNLTNRAQL